MQLIKKILNYAYSKKLLSKVIENYYKIYLRDLVVSVNYVCCREWVDFNERNVDSNSTVSIVCKVSSTEIDVSWGEWVKVLKFVYVGSLT